MTSNKKAGANRQNALKSTGPKTPEGGRPSSPQRAHARARVRVTKGRVGIADERVALPVPL